MNILFLTLSNMENIDQGGIYSDLIKELAINGYNVFVVSPRERRVSLPTELIRSGNINVLMVKTGNITKCNFIEKGLSTLNVERQYLNAINRYFKGIKFDMLMYSTPPITFEKLVRHYKAKYNSLNYLMLKDIFPRNAVDMGLIRQGSLMHKYFRNREKKIYSASDYIGCMSLANIEYILANNPEINNSKVELFPNTIKVLPLKQRPDNYKTRLQRGIPPDKVLFVFGGNLGIPQGIDFLLDCLEELNQYDPAYFLIVGSGTEKEKIEAKINRLNLKNVLLVSYMPRHDYESLMLECDVGLVLLDKRFTIPNYPSRILAYMDVALPVLAATDWVSDIKQLLEDSKGGRWVFSGDKAGFIEQVKNLSENKEMRVTMGLNGRKYLEQNFDVSRSVNILKSHL